MYSVIDTLQAGWVVPFGNPRVKVCLPLSEAYRSLPRPSSASNAKAFTIYFHSLHTIKYISTKLCASFSGQYVKELIFFKLQQISIPGTIKSATYCYLHSFYFHGANRDRTCDILLAKQALSQLSYSPSFQLHLHPDIKKWVWIELNYRPLPYQSSALTN